MYFYSFGLFGNVDTYEVTQEWTDGTSLFRLQVRSSHLFLDQAITPTGFSGTLGIDWAPIFMEKLA